MGTKAITVVTGMWIEMHSSEKRGSFFSSQMGGNQKG